MLYSYKSTIQVYIASKVKKKNNFITFMHEGFIYVRFKNEKTSSLIYSSENLEAFLGQPVEWKWQRQMDSLTAAPGTKLPLFSIA